MNQEILAYMDITEYMMSNDLIEGKDYFIDLAWQDRVGTVYNIQQENSVKVENVCKDLGYKNKTRSENISRLGTLIAIV